MLVILGLGMATRAYLGYSTGVSESDYAAAQYLAMAGLEDFRTKASLDHRFPPKLGDGTVPIIYGEELQDSSGVTLGRFQVQVVTEKNQEPHFVYQIKSTGFSVRARVTMVAYLENRPGLRWLNIEQKESDWY